VISWQRISWLNLNYKKECSPYLPDLPVWTAFAIASNNLSLHHFHCPPVSRADDVQTLLHLVQVVTAGGVDDCWCRPSAYSFINTHQFLCVYLFYVLEQIPSLRLFVDGFFAKGYVECGSVVDYVISFSVGVTSEDSFVNYEWCINERNDGVQAYTAFKCKKL